MIKLSDILRAAFSHSDAGRKPQSLQASVGGPHREQFDFDALSRILGKGTPGVELPAARRERLVRTLGVLESQRFFAPPELDAAEEDGDCFDFVFDNCAAAAQAFRDRLPDVAAMVKAISIAELEAQGRYIDAEHKLVFDKFDEDSLTADDLARFPDYLVCISPDRNDAPENANLLEMLSSGLPVKVLVQTSNLLEDSSIGTGRFAFGVRSARLATAAMGLGGMFVLQTTSANLFALRAKVGRGLACSGPALFSVYAGEALPAPRLPPYLTAAAAMQSRAFPAFSYDAEAGSNWAERFSLENNPQPEDDWPVETLEYVDTALQRASERCAFSFADFVLCDARHAAHFALRPARALGRFDDACRRLARARRARCGTARTLPAGRRRRRRAAARDRRRAPDAGDAPLPAAVAPTAGARRRARLARRTPAGPREGGLGGAAAGSDARTRRGACCREPAAASSRRWRDRTRGARALARRGMDRHRALPELQRMPADQRPHVRLRRAQAGLHQGPRPRAPTASWSKPPRAARSRSSTPARRAIRRSPGSRNCSFAPSPSADRSARNAMSTIIQHADFVESIAAALQYISYYHPADFIEHLARAYAQEQSPAAKDAIAQILTNSKMCAEGRRPICQDTGIVNVFLKIGMDVRFEGFAGSITDAVNEGVRRAYTDPDNTLRASHRRRPAFRAQEHEGQHAGRGAHERRARATPSTCRSPPRAAARRTRASS